jgi:purine-binding chemotaxis protein CheW
MSNSVSDEVGCAIGTMADVAGKYLTFKLGSEEYGLEILKVQEIIKWMKITSIPRTPGFMKGVVNLRGKVIPVVDLRLKFKMEEIENTDATCIIVTQVTQQDAAMTMGIVVDEVSEVQDISAEELAPSPVPAGAGGEQFILGMAKTRESVKILLNVDNVLLADEVSAIMAAA